MTGGLGPTVDDCTREAVAHATGHRLGRRKEALEGMTARLAQWGRRPSTGQLRQAMIPSGATVLKNPVGSAPGFCLTWKKAQIISLPGVPREMEEMMRQEVLPLLRAESGAVGPVSPRADRPSGVPYVRPGGGGRRCQITRTHSKRSAR